MPWCPWSYLLQITPQPGLTCSPTRERPIDIAVHVPSLRIEVSESPSNFRLSDCPRPGPSGRSSICINTDVSIMKVSRYTCVYKCYDAFPWLSLTSSYNGRVELFSCRHERHRVICTEEGSPQSMKYSTAPSCANPRSHERDRTQLTSCCQRRRVRNPA